MAGKKGITPSHVQKKTFSHPGKDLYLISKLEEITDQRNPSLFFAHSLTSVIFMVLVSFLCGYRDWPLVVIFSNGIRDWLANYVDMPSGVPCERTFKHLMHTIDPEEFESLLIEVAHLIRRSASKENNSSHPECVAFDGQTMRGTAHSGESKKAMHLLSAWSSEHQICLGQLKVDDKSNEITAVPQLVRMLDLRGTVITADAMNTQKAIATEIVNADADYVLPVKGNHPQLLENIRLMFEGADKACRENTKRWEHAVSSAKKVRDDRRLEKLFVKSPQPLDGQVELEKAHGRVEYREYTVLPAEIPGIADEWANVASIVRVKRTQDKKLKTHEETTYYISSLPPDQLGVAAHAIRSHWGVEIMHWHLDVNFGQDASRYRDRNGARNGATLRKIVMNTISKDSTHKGSVRSKQCRACIDPKYREALLKNVF